MKLDNVTKILLETFWLPKVRNVKYLPMRKDKFYIEKKSSPSLTS